MTIYYYTFRSMTGAMNAVGRLRKKGIAAVPIRTPEALRQRGCGYCIPIPAEKLYGGTDALSPGTYEKLYLNRDGEWREVKV